MTTPTERAAAVLQARMSWPKADACAQDLERAALLRTEMDEEFKARGGKMLRRYVTAWEEVPADDHN